MKDKITQQVKQLSQLLLTTKLNLITVESCTGGGAGFYCTSLPGSSQWYHCGYITYQNSVKLNLGVPAAILEKYGAVSEQTAISMAEAALNQQEQFTVLPLCSLAITGIAGPDGGSEEKPVGTVCFAWAGRHLDFVGKTISFSGSRSEIREQAIYYALNGMYRFLQQEMRGS